MPNFNVNIEARPIGAGGGGMGGAANIVTANPSRLDGVRAGDTITMVFSNITTNRWVQVNVSSWATDTTTVRMEQNGSVVRTVRSGLPATARSTVTVSNQQQGAAFDLNIVVADTTPNAFSFNDIGDAARSTVYESNVITVSGIDAPSPISITGGSYRINGGGWTNAAGTVSNGQTVQVQCTSSAAFTASVNAVLNIGGVSDTFTVTTSHQTSSIPINMGAPAAIGMLNHLYKLFGGRAGLSEYRRGAGRVPDIPVNAHIPTTLPISLSDFRNSGIILNVINLRRNYIADYIGPSGTTLSLNVAINRDWSVQGHIDLSDQIEVRYTKVALTRGPSADVSASPDWRLAKLSDFNISRYGSGISSTEYSVEMEVRHVYAPASVITCSFNAALIWEA